MKIVVDLQGAQTSVSRMRGIGRQSLGFAKSVARNAGPHEVWIAMSGLFPETIEPLRAEFDGLVPQERLVVWQALTPVAENAPSNRWRCELGERVREAFLSDLAPDIVHLSSLFEGFFDDALTSIGVFGQALPTAVTLHDLIPLLHREHYLSDPSMEYWYERKLTHLRRADLALATSESSRSEGIECLNLPPERVVNVSAAADASFHPITATADEEQRLRHRYGLRRQFVMYTGGIDYRKNVEGLIGAYAMLPKRVRAGHQLAIVCAVSRGEIDTLERLARKRDLGRDEVVLTGFVSERDLVALYNLCKVFSFPSWHEGFGLPALEAMSCGAATIGADAPGVREIIGRPDALFDPRDENAMSAKLHAALTDSAFRNDLRQHAVQRASTFSWDDTGRRAIHAFEELHKSVRSSPAIEPRTLPRRRPRLAYVSPLPPERSGIADYAADLLPELARHYDIEAIVDQPVVDDPWIRGNIECRTVEWFEANATTYDRIVYNFGNSVFHRHMFEMLERHPGVVVLHDFFLSGVIAHMDRQGYTQGAWPTALYVSHGYRAAKEGYAARDPDAAIWRYPANFAVLEQAAGVIVHSEFAQNLAREWYGERYASTWSTIPLLRNRTGASTRAQCRSEMGLSDRDFLVCCFGMMGPTKLNDRLIDAWANSPLAHDRSCHLVFVGETDTSEYGAVCARAIARSVGAGRIRCTNFLDSEQYRKYMVAADAAVQLRGQSRGETSAAILDCMSYGLPTIVNALGAAAELPADCIVLLPAVFSDTELSCSLEKVLREPVEARATGRRARDYVNKHHSPRAIADQYRDAIEALFPLARSTRMRRVATAIADLSRSTSATNSELLEAARCITENAQCGREGPRQWLVEISELVRRDSKSGIQRVVRAVTGAWLRDPPPGFRVEPVYCDSEGTYRYARKFTAGTLGIDGACFQDDVIDTRPGDIFVALDLFLHLQSERSTNYAVMRRRGVRLFFLVYDLLLIEHPNLFVEGGYQSFCTWLQSVADVADGAVCISRTVAEELTQWLDKAQPERLRPLKIGWFHLAAQIDSLNGAPDRQPSVDGALKGMRSRRSVLMVGTIEPRKSHVQALSAFEYLWKRGVDVNLVIVGRQGWMVESLITRLREHPEREQRLFWIESATNEDLQALYQAASGVLMASVGEGFGLPLVEAARHQRPILARDIPVFREVAGAHAAYFTGDSAEILAKALEGWLVAVRLGSAPSSAGMTPLTWDESVRRLTDIILGDRWYREWRYGAIAEQTVELSSHAVAATSDSSDQSEHVRVTGLLASGHDA